MPYRCDGDDDDPVVVIITDQVEAETMALCAQHYVGFIGAMHEAMFPAPEPTAKAPRARGKAKAAAAAAETPSGDVGPVADPTTGDDTDDDGAADGYAENAERREVEAAEAKASATA